MIAKRIVITGAPGTGKSSIIQKLEKHDFCCFPEISREVILEARQQGYDQLFLQKPLLFSELVLKGRLHQFQKASTISKKLLFFDRGIHDVLAYLEYANTNYPKKMHLVCQQNLYDLVFILPPWKEIYTRDNERYESFEEASKIHQHIEKTYKSFQYKPILVPTGTIETRVQFILNNISTLL